MNGLAYPFAEGSATMDSWQFNKIAGAVLAALLIAFGGSTLIGIMYGDEGGHGGEHAKAGYTLPVEVSDSGHSGQAKKKTGFDYAVVFAELAKGDAKAGEGVFKKCKTCHTDNDGGPNRVGPNLWGIVDRPKAAHGGFKYSKVLVEKGGKWTYEDLAHFVHSPKEYARGTKMSFAGIKDPLDLAHLIAYLRTLSATPVPLPTAPPPAAEKKADTAAPAATGDSEKKPAH